ncbi:hypothetical protein CBM2587_A10129 [Cupriavidus taiwanensis]|uniref:Uncharacterized protein n=1 Tax=Cupriavidus taiwanensis TaxID=164546 RepID=A0A975WQQ3_9BURK|nr:hypothetical protein CBM2587_A10129 [Cupriavidus taiwanensis]
MKAGALKIRRDRHIFARTDHVWRLHVMPDYLYIRCCHVRFRTKSCVTIAVTIQPAAALPGPVQAVPRSLAPATFTPRRCHGT